jgi:hypothetical protein
MKTVYQAKDGETFDDPGTAREHENKLFVQWIDDVETGKVEVTLKEVLVSLAHCDDIEDEYYAAPLGLFTAALRSYWDNQCQ